MKRYILKWLGLDSPSLQELNCKLNAYHDLSSMMTEVRFRIGCKSIKPSGKFSHKYNVEYTGVASTIMGYIEDLESKIQQGEKTNDLK